MKVALCGLDALRCWWDPKFCDTHRREHVSLPRNFIPSLAVDEALYLAQRFGISFPVMSAVSEADNRRANKLLRSTVVRDPAFVDGFVPMGASSFLAVPELALLQLAGELVHGEGKREEQAGLLCLDALRTEAVRSVAPAVVLSVLACELMGDYALCRTAEDGFVKRGSLMAREVLDRLAARGSFDGTRLLSRAMKRVFTGSRSPEEASLAMLMSQPVRYGGLGMGIPQMNYQVETTSKGRKNTRYIDVCYPDHMLAFEMNSKAYHPGETAAQDDERRNEITALGYDLVVITPAILFDANRLDEATAPARKKLRLASRPADDYADRRADLRELVFEVNGTRCEENRSRLLGPALKR